MHESRFRRELPKQLMPQSMQQAVNAAGSEVTGSEVASSEVASSEVAGGRPARRLEGGSSIIHTILAGRYRALAEKRLGLPRNGQRLTLVISGSRLDAHQRPVVKLAEGGSPGVGERTAHARGDHVEQIFDRGAKRVEIDLR
jgi:hypothetical protein